MAEAGKRRTLESWSAWIEVVERWRFETEGDDGCHVLLWVHLGGESVVWMRKCDQERALGWLAVQQKGEGEDSSGG